MTLIRRTPPVQPPAPPQEIPQSVFKAGYYTPEVARRRGRKYRGLMLAIEGRSDTGKTEFMLSAPGPGSILAMDRGFDAVFDNPNPPPTRRSDFGILPLQCPVATDFNTAAEYIPYYRAFYQKCMETITIPEIRTFGIDGDNLSWDLQRLAEWGKLTGVYPQTKYFEPTAARMSFYFKLWESGKIIITTNMMTDEYRDVIDPKTGVAVRDEKGESKRERTGDSVAKGFRDQEYLWQVRIRTLYKAPLTRVAFGKEIKVPGQFGLRITKCKPVPSLIGTELWGDSCNFAGLVQTVYPHIALDDWGF